MVGENHSEFSTFLIFITNSKASNATKDCKNHCFTLKVHFCIFLTYGLALLFRKEPFGTSKIMQTAIIKNIFCFFYFNVYFRHSKDIFILLWMQFLLPEYQENWNKCVTLDMLLIIHCNWTLGTNPQWL